MTKTEKLQKCLGGNWTYNQFGKYWNDRDSGNCVYEFSKKLDASHIGPKQYGLFSVGSFEGKIVFEKNKAVLIK